MRVLGYTLLLIGVWTVGTAQHVVVRPEISNDTLFFRVQNDLPCPMTLSVSSETFDTTFTAYLPDKKEHLLFRWPDPKDNFLTKIEQSFSYDFTLGNPNAVHDDQYAYNLPFPEW